MDRDKDWAEKVNRNNWYPIVEEFPPPSRCGNPISSVAIIILIILFVVVSVSLVRKYRNQIDTFGTQIDKSTIILHEQSRGERK